MHAVSSNQIADILHFNDKFTYNIYTTSFNLILSGGWEMDYLISIIPLLTFYLTLSSRKNEEIRNVV